MDANKPLFFNVHYKKCYNVIEKRRHKINSNIPSPKVNKQLYCFIREIRTKIELNILNGNVSL